MLLAHLFGRLCRSKAIQRLRRGWLVSSRQNLSNPKFGHFVAGSITLESFASSTAPFLSKYILWIIFVFPFSYSNGEVAAHIADWLADGLVS